MQQKSDLSERLPQVADNLLAAGKDGKKVIRNLR
jgi:hypothetical protein